MHRDWWDMSCRLRRFIMTRSHIVYGYKWSQQCGAWVVMIVKKRDAYNNLRVEEK